MTGTTVAPVTTPRRPAPSPWVAMFAILSGSYMVVLDTTVLGVALPEISADLDAAESIGIDWVVTSYLVAVGIIQPATGWMADRFGRKRVFIVALAVFTAASAVSAVAPTFELLVAARVLQGLGGGAMMPVGMAMVYELFPPERRGVALGVWGVAMMAAPTVGPPAGGWLVTSASWRWIFLVNVPIGMLALALTSRVLRDVGFREVRPLDWRGWVLTSSAIVAVVVGVRRAGDLGWTAPVTVVSLAGAAVAFSVMIVWARRHPHPLLELRMFGVPTFALGNLVGALTTVALYARVAFLPVELQVVRGMTAAEVGVLLVAPAIAVASTMPVGGWLADHVGSRLPVTVGLGGLSVSSWFLANVTPETSLTAFVVILVVGGLGTGLALTPTTVAAMNALPRRWVAQATTVNSLNRQVAAAIGTAVLATVVVAQLGAVAPAVGDGVDVLEAQSVYNDVFLVAFVVTAAATVLALFLPGRRAMAALQAERAGELAADTP